MYSDHMINKKSASVWKYVKAIMQSVAKMHNAVLPRIYF